MEEGELLIQRGILRDMSEGVLAVGLDGIIRSVNPSAEKILSISRDRLEGRPFAACFFEHPENDAFNQAVLDAIYDSASTHSNIVPYFTGAGTRQLHVTTSFLRVSGRKIGVIAVLSDITELVELRDAVKAMERIKQLNEQLELRNKLIYETFGRYMSDRVVRNLLETPDGLKLGGKKQLLTVLMSDLRGFTAMSERMDAQELLTMLNHYLGEMTRVIERRGGTIIEFIGDGILAIFGAPSPSETHAGDAAACAVEMQAAMAEVNAWNSGRGYPRLEMGIGVNTGEMIVGNIGSRTRAKYGVVGRNVNICGRIESYTVGGQVLVSPETRALAGAALEIAQELEVFPKGAGAPLSVAQVVAVGEPYCVSCRADIKAPEPLAKPVGITCFAIRDKHCEAEPLRCDLTALSEDAALMRANVDLDVYSNVKLGLPCGNAFAKVLEAGGGVYGLRFTALPDGFKSWRESLE